MTEILKITLVYLYDQVLLVSMTCKDGQLFTIFEVGKLVANTNVQHFYIKHGDFKLKYICQIVFKLTPQPL